MTLGTELVSLQQDSDAVVLSLKADDGSTSTLRARWVIGCDGGASTVHSQVGIELEDLDFDEPWLVVDVRVNARGLAKLPKTSVQYCEPERACPLVIGPGCHRRRFHALVAESWRSGREFLAGDAAHMQPPFLGQGMCQRLRDGSNLSWKLGAVLYGTAAAEADIDALLAERQAALL